MRRTAYWVVCTAAASDEGGCALWRDALVTVAAALARCLLLGAALQLRRPVRRAEHAISSGLKAAARL